MSAAAIFLGLSILGFALSIATCFRLRIAGPLLVPTFFVGWLRGELALRTETTTGRSGKAAGRGVGAPLSSGHTARVISV